MASQLSVAPDVTDEADVAARHGAAHLALAAATAAAVLPRVDAGEWATQPPTVLGVAIGTAVLRLRETPMPAKYRGGAAPASLQSRGVRTIARRA